MPDKKPLITQHLENIHREALEKHQGIIKEYIRKKGGIYVLYQKGKLYYVGLATNLSSRLKDHLNDKHGQSWDTFSVYLTVHDEHRKELESFVLRILQPTGNSVKGKFAKSENLHKQFENDLKQWQDEELNRLMGKGKKKIKPAHENEDAKPDGKVSELSKYITQRMPLRATWKKQTYKASLRKDGTISYNKQIYQTPSGAGKGVRGRATNGWTFWHYKNENGEWVKLTKLREQKVNPKPEPKQKKQPKTTEKPPVLAQYITKGFQICFIYKGTTHKAKVKANGTILYDGQVFISPSGAGKAAIGRIVNGWNRWKYKNETGNWVKLDELRKKK